MRFQELLLSILSEAPSEKQILATNALKEKLKQKWIQLTTSDIDKYFDWFQKTKDTFNLDNVAIRNFLYRFDGNHGFEKFQPERPNDLPIIQNLKVIQNYTQKQIIDLYREFTKTDDGDDEVDEEEVFKSKNRAPTPEKIDASKNLWYGDKYLIYNNGGFRIYEIPNQFVSINYGYYLNTFHSEPYKFSGSQWCTTWWNENNYYASKRPSRYFYFIIDESKHPDVVNNKDISKFYLSAFQVFKPGMNQKYALTDITNPGEPSFTKEEILKIYPKISNIFDSLEYKSFDVETELFIKNVISRINEIEGDRYEYARMNRRDKLLYITNGGTLREKKSWEYSDKILRNTYIMNSNRQNILEKFSTFELFKILSESDKTALNNKVKMLFPNNGIELITNHIMKNDFFIDQRISLLNPNISLYQNRTKNLFGLWNKSNGDWVKLNNIVYNNEYKELKDNIIFSDENDENYLVEVYSKTGVEDDTSFYAIFPMGTSDINCYFVSKKQWDKLNEKIEELSGSDIEFNPDIESDLKEIGEF